MNADQLTNPRSNVLTACPERSEGFKRSNAPTPGLSKPKASILPIFPPANVQTFQRFRLPTFHPRPLFLNQPHLLIKQLTRSILQ
jgi:hypothetical protein